MNKFFLSTVCFIATFLNAQEVKAPPIETPKKEEIKTEVAQTETPKVDAPKAEAPKTELKEKPDVAKISEAFGHMIGKNIETMGVKFDIAKVVKGLQDASEGRESPMSEAECVQAIAAAHEAAFKEASVQNLKKAEDFLKTNSTAPGVISSESGKLQHRIDKEGAGAIVDEHCTPLIKYSGKFLDGTAFGSKEEMRVNLEEDELIPGFAKSLVGMKEGEKRTIYVHPDLGFGTKNYQLPPNSLITFEIEVMKSHSPSEKPADALTTIPSEEDNSEIATPLQEQKAVR